MTHNELVMLQSLPLEVKVAKTKLRIREAIEHFGIEGVYVPVSGGLDSTVLSHIVEQYQLENNIPKHSIPRVNSNTGNEYDEVLEMARKISDLEVRPKMTLYEVLTYEGYPVASKKTSRMLRDLQNPTEKNEATRKLYLEGVKRDGTITKSFKIANKWKKFIDSPIKCSEKCCDILKKEPLKKYEKEVNRIPLLGTMADEGSSRKSSYMKTGCNSFKDGKSMPLGFWTKQDILQYIIDNKIEYASVYGDIIEQDSKLSTTGESRTGCVFCTLGVQLEPKNNNRFHRLKELDPRKYDFCIKGGGVNSWGQWVPKNGLGMGKILDEMGVDY